MKNDWFRQEMDEDWEPWENCELCDGRCQYGEVFFSRWVADRYCLVICQGCAELIGWESAGD